MTVGELRELLHKMDNDKEVVVNITYSKDLKLIVKGSNRLIEGVNYIVLTIMAPLRIRNIQ